VSGRLSNARLARRLAFDYALLALALWNLLGDLGRPGWTAFDGALALLFAWLAFVDAWNWKDPGSRITPARRSQP